MRVLVHHLYAKLWARAHDCRYAKVRGLDKGIMELPTGQRFSFTLAPAEHRKLPLWGLPAFGRQLAYQYRTAGNLAR